MERIDTRISADVFSGLKRMGNSTLINDELFSKLLVSGASALTQPDSQFQKLPSLATSSSKGDLMKEAHFALLSLLIEAARLDISSESLHLFLETKANWPTSRCMKFTGAFTDVLPQIQASLSNVGHHLPHVVDVQWCLHQNIKSSISEHTENSVVAVQLKTEGSTSSAEQDVQFMCTLPELQDLVSKLKDALRQIEHVAQISN